MTRFEAWAVWSTSAAATATGVGLFWAKYLVRNSDPWAVVNHPWQPWLLKAHILVVPLLVFAIGLVFTRHVWRHFRSRMRWGRRSGVLTAAATLPMVATGYLIQAVTHAGWLQALAVAHIGLGVVYAAALALHQPAVRNAKPLKLRRPLRPRTAKQRLGNASGSTPSVPTGEPLRKTRVRAPGGGV